MRNPVYAIIKCKNRDMQLNISTTQKRPVKFYNADRPVLYTVHQILWKWVVNSEEQPEQVLLTREPDLGTDLVDHHSCHLKQEGASFPYSFDRGIPNLRVTEYVKCLWAIHLCHGPASHPSGEEENCQLKDIPGSSSMLSDILLLGLPQVREMLQVPTAHAQEQMCTKL